MAQESSLNGFQGDGGTEIVSVEESLRVGESCQEHNTFSSLVFTFTDGM